MNGGRLATVTAIAVVAGAGGAATAHLLDPESGRSRRARLVDRSRAVIRRDARAAERLAKYEQGRLAGRMHKLVPRRHHQPENDQVLMDKVRSEVLGGMQDLAPHVTIDAAKGMVSLRGELAIDGDIARLERAVREVDGVQGVINLLHRPGEPAPNKAAALHAVQ